MSQQQAGSTAHEFAQSHRELRLFRPDEALGSGSGSPLQPHQMASQGGLTTCSGSCCGLAGRGGGSVYMNPFQRDKEQVSRFHKILSLSAFHQQ